MFEELAGLLIQKKYRSFNIIITFLYNTSANINLRTSILWIFLEKLRKNPKCGEIFPKSRNSPCRFLRNAGKKRERKRNLFKLLCRSFIPPFAFINLSARTHLRHDCERRPFQNTTELLRHHHVVIQPWKAATAIRIRIWVFPKARYLQSLRNTRNQHCLWIPIHGSCRSILPSPG